MTDAHTAGSTTYELRQPTGSFIRFIPWGLGFMTLAGGSVIVRFVTIAFSAPVPFGRSLVSVLFVLPWVAAAVYYWLTLPHVIRQARVHQDGSVQLTQLIGKDVTLRAGDVAEIREQQFLPLKAITRVLTRDEKRYYLSTFERKHELIAAASALRLG